MNMTPDEHSFLYGNPIASTPLARHHLHHLEGGQAGGDWAEGMSSMESPYASLDRKMKAVLENDEGMSSTHTGGFAGDKSDSTLGGPGATPRQGGSGQHSVNEPYQTPEGLDEEPSVLISRTDMGKITGRNGRQDASLASTDLPDLPTANKPKARVPFKSPRAAQNPFSPGGFGAGGKTRTAAGSGSASGSGSGQAWNGIADLRNTPLNSKIKPLSFAKRTPTQARPGQPANIDADGSFDASSDEDEVPSAGMMGTPPMTMNFSLPTRTIISKTPAKEAAKAVMKNLMMDDGMMDSPAMPTPPAFSKYAAQHRSDVMRSGGGGGGGTARRLFTHEMDHTGDLDEGDATVRLDRVGSQMESLGMNDSIPMEDEAGPSVRESDVSTVGMPKHRRSTVPQLDFLDESFDDSLDEMPLPALPQGYVTESYGTADEEVEHDAGEPQHGDDSLALGGDEGGDFTITESGQQGGREEVTGYGEDEGMTGGTVRSEAGEIFGGQGRAMSNKGQFALFGPDEMQTFHGGVSLETVDRRVGCRLDRN